MTLEYYPFGLRRLFIGLCLLVSIVLFYLYQTEAGWRLPTKSAKPQSAHPLYPSDWTLADLKHFGFLLNSNACDSKWDGPIELLVIVTSHPSHTELRAAFRRSLPIGVLRSLGIRRVFLLARVNSAQRDYGQVSQSVIEDEHLEHGDIVQGSFIESYRNLSYKHLMGLKYAVHLCSRTPLVLKMDDDIAVDVFQLLDSVRDLSGLRIAGAIMRGDELQPLRESGSKWSVNQEEFALSRYPPFVSGWAYVITQEAARRLVQHSESSPFFWIDDVYVTGMLANLSGIARVDIRSRVTTFSDHLRCCLKHRESWCDYFIGPVDEPPLLEAFYRQALECKRLGTCAKDSRSSQCVIQHREQALIETKKQSIQGLVIPLQ